MKHHFCVFIALVLAVVVTDCASYHLDREEAWRSLPVERHQFEQLENYTVLIFKQNRLLRESEAGSAWKVLLRFADGELEEYLATAFAYSKDDQKFFLPPDSQGYFFLIAIIPKSLRSLKTLEARTALVSHDAVFCYDLDAKESICHDLDEFDWQKNSSSMDHAQVKGVVKGDFLHQQLVKLYTDAVTSLMVEKFGTSLSQKELDYLKSQDRTLEIVISRILADTLIFTEVTLLADIVSGVATIGLSELLNLITILLSPPNLDFPEYGLGKATNRGLAIKALSLHDRIWRMEQGFQEHANRLEARIKYLEAELLKERLKEKSLEPQSPAPGKTPDRLPAIRLEDLSQY